MKKEKNGPYKIESLTVVHRDFGLPKPTHPLISLINGSIVEVDSARLPKSHILSFYKISYKPKLSGKLKYGQSYYDFDEGGCYSLRQANSSVAMITISACVRSTPC